MLTGHNNDQYRFCEWDDTKIVTKTDFISKRYEYNKDGFVLICIFNKQTINTIQKKYFITVILLLQSTIQILTYRVEQD